MIKMQACVVVGRGAQISGAAGGLGQLAEIRKGSDSSSPDAPSLGGHRDSMLKIAIVDESPIRAAILEDGLREAGFVQVERIAETRNLLARVYALDPDVILIDLESPSRDMLEQMFQMSRVVKRPVAMFVDQSDSASIQAAVDAGVSAYIVDGLKKERVTSILDLCISRFNAFSRLQGELDRAKDRAGRAQGDRPRQGRADESEEAQRGAGLCADAQDRHEREQEDRRHRAIGAHRRGAVQMSNARAAHRISSRWSTPPR